MSIVISLSFLNNLYTCIQRKVNRINTRFSYVSYSHSFIYSICGYQFNSLKKIVIIISLSIIEIILLTTLTIYLIFAQEIKGKTSVVNYRNSGVILYDRNGKELYTFYNAKNFQYISLSNIPKITQDAIIASEDKGFYHHPGFSISGILRALFIDIKENEPIYGGSTITQQLVKNALLTPQKSLLRKYEEIVLASELERRFTKDDILEMYLNSVYFGEGAFGIQNAAHEYFNKNAKDLTLSESAMLSSLLPAPSALSPISHGIAQIKKHQIIVLKELENQGYISHRQKILAENEPLVLHPAQKQANTIGIHFALMVKDYLASKYGEDFLAHAGFKVKTSLDLDWQKYAEQIVSEQITRLQYDHASNGAVVVIDPKNGQIRALVGSVDWFNPSFGKVNMAITPRQPGSSFKPIVYATALKDVLITPSTILQDIPTTFPGNYKPHDYDLKYRGPVTVRRALANSLNIPAVEVMQMLGVQGVLDAASQFGITTLSKKSSDYGLSLVLGSGEVPLLELTNVYASFANNGIQYSPSLILQITDKKGQVIYTDVPHPKPVSTPQVSFLISSILSDNQARAEEFGSTLTISRPAAVKTGTSEDFKNALTFGYTHSLVVGVWVGNNNSSPMDNIAGSLGAAPIWKQLMEKFLTGTTVEKFTPPEGITSEYICQSRGLRVQQATSSAYLEYYLAGTQPSAYCYDTDQRTYSFPSISPYVSNVLPPSDFIQPTTNFLSPTL